MEILHVQNAKGHAYRADQNFNTGTIFSTLGDPSFFSCCIQCSVTQQRKWPPFSNIINGIDVKAGCRQYFALLQ